MSEGLLQFNQPVNEGGIGGELFVTVVFPVIPRGKGRPRSRIVQPRGGKPFVHVYSDPATVAYEKMLAWHAKVAMKGREPLEGPLAMRLFCMMPIPVSWPKRDRDAALIGTKFPVSSFDADNILKAAGDAFNEIVYLDDKQIVRALVVKEYAERPGIIAEIYTLP